MKDYGEGYGGDPIKFTRIADADLKRLEEQVANLKRENAFLTQRVSALTILLAKHGRAGNA